MLDVFKTLTNGILEKAKTFKGDWNENDSNSPNYIKNRTHWVEPAQIVIAAEQTFSGTQFGPVMVKTPIIEGQKYTVIYNGTEYECTARNYDGYLMLGNNAVYEYDNGINTDTGEPFAIEWGSRGTDLDGYGYSNVDTQHIIKIVIDGEKVHKLDEKYLPDLSQYAKADDIYNAMDQVYSDIDNLSNNVYTKDEVYSKDELAAVATTGSWEDLENRPFYSKATLIGEETISGLTTETTDYGTVYKYKSNLFNYNNIKFNKTYIVELDGVQYEAVSQRYTGMSVSSGTVLSTISILGNPLMYNDSGWNWEPKNDVPFMLTRDTSTYSYVYMDKQYNKIAIYEANTELKCIDEKYLPPVLVKSINGEVPDKNGDIELIAPVGKNIVAKHDNNYPAGSMVYVVEDEDKDFLYLKQQIQNGGQVYSVAVTSDGSLAIVGREVYRIVDGSMVEIGQLYADTNGTVLTGIETAAFSPNDKWLVVGGRFDSCAKLYSVSNETITYVSDIYADINGTSLSGNDIENAVFSPDGSLLVLSGYYVAKLYSVTDTGVTYLCDIGTVAHTIYNVSFSPNGKLLMVGNALYSVDDNEITYLTDIYDQNGEMLGQMSTKDSAFSSDGSLLVVLNKYIYLYSVNNDTISLLTNCNPYYINYNGDSIDKVVFIGDSTRILAGGLNGASSGVSKAVIFDIENNKLTRIYESKKLYTGFSGSSNNYVYNIVCLPNDPTSCIISYNGGVDLYTISNQYAYLADVDMWDSIKPNSVYTVGMITHRCEWPSDASNITVFSHDVKYLPDNTQDDNYYTKEEIDAMELITVADIDEICGSSIVAASEVTY